MEIISTQHDALKQVLVTEAAWGFLPEAMLEEKGE